MLIVFDFVLDHGWTILGQLRVKSVEANKV
jgi:hypothetical protein